MKSRITALCAAVALSAAVLGSAAPAEAACPNPIPVNSPFRQVTRTPTVIDGLRVDLYRWFDSQCLERNVALKKQSGNPGNGGYAVRMTYRVPLPDGTYFRVVATQSGGGDGGFGYFVSHERFRTFTDGSSGPIAARLGADDSPLGRNFPVSSQFLTPAAGTLAHRFTLTYPRYGTIDPISAATDENGVDIQRTPTNLAAYRLYPLPVTITWVFQALKDFPRIDTVVDLRGVPGPDRVQFDVRGPYGVLFFDNGIDGLITAVNWGDRFHFRTLDSPVTRNSDWRWDKNNYAGRRYTALLANRYEMGLFEPVLWTVSALRDNWAGERGSTSALWNGGQGCTDPIDQLLPCDWAWPYQSLQYSLPYDNSDAPTNFPKIAWGSAPYYGTSLPRVYDTNETSRPFVGWPADRRLRYSVCLVLGRSIPGGLTRAVAGSATPSCAATPVP